MEISMNIQTETLLEKEKKLKKYLLRGILWIAYPIYALQSLAVYPLYTILESNVALASVAPVFKYIGILMDLFVFFLSNSIIIYGLLRLSFSRIRSVFWLVLCLPLFKYALKLAISPLIDGIPGQLQFWMDLYTIALSAALEMLQFLIIFWLTSTIIKHYKLRLCQETGKMKATVNIENLIPFPSTLRLKNPLLGCAFGTALIVTTVRIVMLIISDLNHHWIITGFSGYLVFFGFYLLELLFGFLGYLLMLMIFMQLASLEAKETNKSVS